MMSSRLVFFNILSPQIGSTMFGSSDKETRFERFELISRFQEKTKYGRVARRTANDRNSKALAVRGLLWRKKIIF